MKSGVRELMSFHTATPINSLTDLLSLLEGNTSVKISTFSAEDVKRERSTLPTSLAPLKGAYQIHQLKVGSDGRVLAKKLPGDSSSIVVNLSPRNISVASDSQAARLRAPAVEVHPNVVQFPT